MDSLTQIVLGAAAGEVVLGKKIGNRAMLWGAIGGTIPDLDVLGSFFLSEIDNLAFHRGISHSILFSIVGALVFGWIVHQIYKSPYHKWIATVFKTMAAILVGFALNFVANIFFPGNIIAPFVLAIGLAVLLYFNIKRSYFSDQWEAPEASVRNWQWLFFWSLLTHPILDCFTMYGTQLFAPFSDVRVSWATVSVADPMYTLPFLICLIIASRYFRTSNKRRMWNYLGIGLSSCYLLFTVFNKQHINKVYSDAFEKQGIAVERYVTNATIFTNILWSATAETKDHFYIGQYSMFDEVPIEFAKVDKNHRLLKNINTDPTIATLKWFSDNYFNVIDLGEKFQFNDLRFGTFNGKITKPEDYIFKFYLRDSNKGYKMEEAVGGPPEDDDGENIFVRLFERIKGKKAF